MNNILVKKTGNPGLMDSSEGKGTASKLIFRKRKQRRSTNQSDTRLKESSIAGIFSDNNCIRIKSAYDMFNAIDVPAFEKIVNELCGAGMSESRKIFVYYLVLFRKEPHVRTFFEKASMPLYFISSVILYVAARSGKSPEESSDALDDILNMIPKETLFNLAVSTDAIVRDKKLMLHVLSKMDIRYLDRYFENMEKVNEFISGMSTLPKNLVKTYFFRNPQLHGYYVFLLNAVDTSGIPNVKELSGIDLTEVAEVKKIADYLTRHYDLQREKDLPLPKRDKDRYAAIVSSVRHLENVVHVLSGLENEGVINGEERDLIEEILSNPIFRDVREKYGSRVIVEKKTEVEFML
jgi:hypothetical protein